MMKRLLIFSLIVAMTFTLFGCGGGSAGSGGGSTPGSQPSSGGGSGSSGGGSGGSGGGKNFGNIRDIKMGTATTSGFYYPLGAAIAQVWNNAGIGDIRFSSQATDGSVQNVNLMAEGEIHVGMSNPNILVDAVNGRGQFQGNAFGDFAVITTLFPSFIQIAARRDSGINTMADIRGKRVVPGAPGSSTAYAFQALLEVYGIDMNKDTNAQYVGYTEAVEFMRNRQVDAIAVLSSVPVAAITEATLTADAKLLPIEDEYADKFIANDPTYYKDIIPAGTYEGQTEDIKSVVQPNVLFVQQDLPEDLIYEMTKAIWENIEELRKNLPQLETMKIENAAATLNVLPLHPGAQRYYEEVGVLKK